MTGGGSIQLARVFGVRIGVHPSWFVVLFLIIWSLSGYYKALYPREETLAFVLATVSALLLFASLLVHELGHALVARRNGIGIGGIDLWLFGGVAKMTRDTDSPAVEFRVAAAGPLVTLAIVVLAVALGAVVGGLDALTRGAAFRTDTEVAPLVAVLGWVAFVNTALLLFNVIPGLPLDGGRMIRALAWWRTGNRSRATRFAARLGRGFAWVFAAAGLLMMLTGEVVGGVWLLFIGLLVMAPAARAAELQSELTARIEGLQVADVMDAEPVTIPVQTSVEDAEEQFFLRYGWSWFPVVDQGGHLVGVLSRERLQGLPEPVRAGRSVGQLLAEGPASFQVDIDEPLEALLGSEPLRRLGALMAVDRDGVLRGVVTLDQVRRALRPAGTLG